MSLKLRVGETVGVEAGVVDDRGAALPDAALANPVFLLGENTGAVELVDVGDDYARDLTALEPGADVVTFGGVDPFYDPLSTQVAVTVIDANGLVILGGDRENDKLMFKVDGFTLPNVKLVAIPVDERTSESEPTPAYTTTDEAWSCDPVGGVLFSPDAPGDWNPTATGTLTVYVQPNTEAAGTIHVSAKNSSGVVISGSLAVVCHGPAGVTLAQTPAHGSP